MYLITIYECITTKLCFKILYRYR